MVSRLRRQAPQTVASFRAGLTASEFGTLLQQAGIERAAIRKQFLTHQTIECVAMPYRANKRRLTRPSPFVRVMKSLFVSKPAPLALKVVVFAWTCGNSGVHKKPGALYGGRAFWGFSEG